MLPYACGFCFFVFVYFWRLFYGRDTTEASSTMRASAGVLCSGTYHYSECVKPGISTMNARDHSHR